MGQYNGQNMKFSYDSTLLEETSATELRCIAAQEGEKALSGWTKRPWEINRPFAWQERGE